MRARCKGLISGAFFSKASSCCTQHRSGSQLPEQSQMMHGRVSAHRPQALERLLAADEICGVEAVDESPALCLRRPGKRPVAERLREYADTSRFHRDLLHDAEIDVKAPDLERRQQLPLVGPRDAAKAAVAGVGVGQGDVESHEARVKAAALVTIPRAGGAREAFDVARADVATLA